MVVPALLLTYECLHEEEEEDLTSSANQLGCTDVPGLSITWSKTSVLSVYHV